jgi:hypothetical protein
MARRGETIENALSGERMTFLETTRDTNGRFFEFEFIAPPGWTVAGHVHSRQEERTEMLSGTLDGVVAAEGLTLSRASFASSRRVSSTPGKTRATMRPVSRSGSALR